MRKPLVGAVVGGASLGMAVMIPLALAGSASADNVPSAPGALKVPLAGPAANFYCVGLGEVGDDSQSGPGFVIYTQDRSANTVSADVVLKDASPNTTYLIQLVQSDGTGCGQVDGTLTTNGQGNGEALVTEPISPGVTAVRAFVAPSFFTSPSYDTGQTYTLTSASGNPNASVTLNGSTTASGGS